MVDGKFDIVFAGRTVPGKTPEEVQQNLAKLFKTGESQIKRLFLGGEVAIKKGLDYTQAMKYQSALKQAGALVLIKPVQDGSGNTQSEPAPQQAPASQDSTTSQDTPSNSHKHSEPVVSQQPVTSSQGRASFGPKETEEVPKPVSHGRASFGPKEPEDVAEAPTSQGRANFGPKETEEELEPQKSSATDKTATDESTVEKPEAESDGGWSLANAGERLPETEKQPPIPEPDLSELSVANSGEPLQKVAKKEQRDVDTSELSLDEPGLIQEPKPFEAKEVDTSDLSVAAAGEKIPNEQKKKQAVNPNIDHLKIE